MEYAIRVRVAPTFTIVEYETNYGGQERTTINKVRHYSERSLTNADFERLVRDVADWVEGSRHEDDLPC